MGQGIDPNSFPDQLDSFRVQQQQLERRRELAKQMIQQGMEGSTGAGYHGGRVYMVGSPLGNVAQGLAGAFMDNKANTEATDLAARRSQAEQGLMNAIPAEAGPERQQAMLRAVQQAPNLRDAIKLAAGWDEAEAQRIEKGEQAAADRVARSQEAEAARIDRGEQQAADRVAREDLRRIPAQSVHVSVGGGGKAPGFKVPSGYMLNEAGDGVVPIPGMPAKPPASEKPLNEAQGNATLFGTRMAEADKVLSEVGTDYSPMKLDIARGAEAVPGGSAAVNATLSDKEQKVAQAQRDFINAVLRKESGAAISPSEFDNARRQYFPQPNDSDAVKVQKKANRETAIKGMKLIAGPGGKHIDNEPAPLTVVRTGTRNGVKVQQMSDGSIREVK